MNENYVALLEYLKDFCGDEYKVVKAQDLTETIKGDRVTEEEIKSMITQLNMQGYLDIKYSDGTVAVLKPLQKSYELDNVSKEQEPLTENKAEKFRLLLPFIVGFCGAFVGAVAGIIVAVVIIC